MKPLSVIRPAILSWCLYMALELPTIAMRRAALAPALGQPITDLVGIALSVFLACLTAYWFLYKGWFPAERRLLYGIGTLWVILSIAVESLAFHQSNLSVLGLLALFFVPMGVARRNRVID